jgi:exodeoxyribonuclease VII small subunit
MAKKNFEQSMQDLEKIVKELEAGDLPLERALKRFEEGMTLAQQCSQMLDETEKRVGQLIKNSEGFFSEQPFENEDEEQPS